MKDNNPKRIFPCSLQQEGVWFHAAKYGVSYWNFIDYKIFEGLLDTHLLQHALLWVINEQKVLRTNFFIERDQICQIVQEAFDINKSFQIHSYSEMDDREMMKVIGDTLHQEERYDFDYESEILLRFKVMNFGTRWCLMVNMNHIITDNESMSIFWSKIAHHYNTLHTVGMKSSKVEEPKLPYFTYAEQQRKIRALPEYHEQFEYWSNKLSIPLKPINFFHTPNGENIYSIESVIPESIIVKARTLSLKKRVLLSSIFLASYFTFLSIFEQDGPITVGNMVHGRGFPRKIYDDIIGLFAKRVMHIQTVRWDSSFLDLLQDVNNDLMLTLKNGEVSFEELVRHYALQPGNAASIPISAIFNMFREGIHELELKGLKENKNFQIKGSNVGDIQYDLSLSIVEKGDGGKIRLDFKCDKYFEPIVDQYMDHFRNILFTAIEKPELSVKQILESLAKERIVSSTQKAASNLEMDGKSVIDLFNKAVAHFGNEIAIISENKRLTYSQVDSLAMRLGEHLRGLGVEKETLVALCLGRSEWMIIGILGILKAGGAYVPLQPEYPQERLEYMLNDTGCKFLVGDTLGIKMLSSIFYGSMVDVTCPRSWNTQAPLPSNFSPDNLAYVIYTSGSTGLPKGVMVEHANLVSFFKNLNPVFRFSPKYRIAATTNFGFDISVLELIAPLTIGMTVIILPNDIDKLEEIIESQSIDVVQLTPSRLNQLLDVEGGGLEKLTNLKILLVGGEALGKRTFQTLKMLHSTTLIQVYGPTETTIWSTCQDINNEQILTIGNPLLNEKIYLCNDKIISIPKGTVGEILIGGEGVTRGYLNKKDLTREKFIYNSHGAGERLYRTGDLGRFLPNGQIEFLGRRDTQVKVRGYRIELEEIESAVLESGFANQVAVSVQDDLAGGKYLVGYTVCSSALNKNGLIKCLRDKLPGYMVPEVWIKLDVLPLNNNGKIDRKLLPKPTGRKYLETEYIAPVGYLENRLCQIWQSLLNVDSISVLDNFFSIGGHSLTAIRLISAVRKELGVTLSIRDIFANPTITELGKILAEKEHLLDTNGFVGHEEKDSYPLSYGQERLWFIDQLEGSKHYHIPVVYETEGRIDRTALEASVRKLIQRHKTLRSVVQEDDGHGIIRVLDSENWSLNHSYLDNGVSKTQFIIGLLQQPFNLARDFMIRAHIVNYENKSELLVIVVHHIAADGWSLGILFNELSELYNSTIENRKPILSTLSIQYGDYSIWQREHICGSSLEGRLAYWINSLKGSKTMILPSDKKRPLMQSIRGEYIQRSLPVYLYQKVKDICIAEETTPFMFFLAILKVFLYHFSGENDICVGTPVAGRIHQEIEKLIGLFVNTLALRNKVDRAESFNELLSKVKENFLDAYEHQDIPFEKVVEAIAPERDLGRTPLFQVMFSMEENGNENEFQLTGLKLKRFNVSDGSSKFDLTFTIYVKGANAKLGIEYCSDLFYRDTVERMLTYYVHVLESAVYNIETPIGELRLIGESEERELLSHHGGTSDEHRGKTVIDLFRKAVRDYGERRAVVFGDRVLSYGELDMLTDRLAS
ncbi:amino acid adenylation domain-containing protein, partial [Olivibacter sp. CPCC 100613]|uniref:amino acid adenylation domain-containing protein n=1 Tax=Olivibacter sp. CPCC 100613 TaxID=3079931 RepID=UPI002FFB976C